MSVLVSEVGEFCCNLDADLQNDGPLIFVNGVVTCIAGTVAGFCCRYGQIFTMCILAAI